MRRVLLCATAIMAVVPSNPAAATDAKSIWKDTIKRCTKSDLVKHGVVFMGLSSNFGPGTIFKDVASGVQIYLPASSYITPADESKVIQVGQESDCSGVSNKTFKVDANADLSKLIPVSLGVDYHNVKGVTLEPTNVRWDDLIIGNYETLATAAAPNVKQALFVKRQPVVSRAVHVSGLKAKVTFNNGFKVDLSKLPVVPGGITVNIGTDGSLEITSTSSFYIAGVMSRFDGGSLQAGAKPKLRPITTGADKNLVPGK